MLFFSPNYVRVYWIVYCFYNVSSAFSTVTILPKHYLIDYVICHYIYSLPKCGSSLPNFFCQYIMLWKTFPMLISPHFYVCHGMNSGQWFLKAPSSSYCVAFKRSSILTLFFQQWIKVAFLPHPDQYQEMSFFITWTSAQVDFFLSLTLFSSITGVVGVFKTFSSCLYFSFANCFFWSCKHLLLSLLFCSLVRMSCSILYIETVRFVAIFHFI